MTRKKQKSVDSDDETNQLDALFKKVLWVTREMAENLGRDYILMTTLKETIYFLIFGFFATLICLGMANSSMFHLYKVINEQLFENNDFDDVNSASKFWSFLDNFFTRSFYWDYWYYPDEQVSATNIHDRNIFYENYLLGVPRLRQLRVKQNSCSIHEYFKKIFLTCYGRYSHHNEDTQPFGYKNSSAWTWQSSYSTGTSSYWGKIDWYHGGGYIQDLGLTMGETLNLIKILKNGLWITRSTRVIFLDFAVYNSNVNLFSIISCFEFPPTGGVIASKKIHVVKLLRYATNYDFFIMGCETIIFGFHLYYTMEEIREIIYFKTAYFKKFWSYIDLLILILGYTAMTLGVIRTIWVDQRIEHLSKSPQEFSNLDMLSTFQKIYCNLLAVQLFFIYLKVFKYLNFNKNMAQLNNTLSKCKHDMMGFALMFFVIFIAFSVLGYLLFGTEVRDFSSFYLAMFTLLRTILGDFDYKDIETANRILAPIFFICFIFLVFFVLLNMFLAIINDTYTDVKTEIAMSPEELQMTGFLKRGYYNILMKMGLKKLVKKEKVQKTELDMTAGEIRAALKHIGFSDMEIEMFFARYNIKPNAEVKEYSVNRLLEVLEGKIDPTPPTMDRRKKDMDKDKPMVAIDDFMKQQERLEEIEKALDKTTEALATLLSRLSTLENVRKVKKDPKANQEPEISEED